MPWGIENFVYWDPFYWGPQGLIMNFIIWTLFAYLSGRGSSDKPLEDAMQIMGYCFGMGLLMDFMGIPSLFVGWGMLGTYLLATKYVVKWNWGRTLFVAGTITFNLSISSILPPMVSPIYLWGVIMGMLFLRSQERIRQKKIEAEMKNSKK